MSEMPGDKSGDARRDLPGDAPPPQAPLDAPQPPPAPLEYQQSPPSVPGDALQPPPSPLEYQQSPPPVPLDAPRPPPSALEYQQLPPPEPLDAPQPPPSALEYQRPGAARDLSHPGLLMGGIVSGIIVSLAACVLLPLMNPLPGGPLARIVIGIVVGVLCVVAGMRAFHQPRRRWFLAGVLLALAACALLEGLCFSSPWRQ